MSRQTRHSGAWTGSPPFCLTPALFIYLYVRKETVFSSQIEGTQSSFSDLMLFESAEAPAAAERCSGNLKLCSSDESWASPTPRGFSALSAVDTRNSQDSLVQRARQREASR